MRSQTRTLRVPTTQNRAARGRRYRWAALAVVLLTAALMWSGAASASCNFLLAWGSTGPANGQFQGPRGIALDSAGNVYVAEGNGNRVQKFDSGGNFISKFGTPGEIDGGFINAYGIAFSPSGDIYVTDSSPDRTTGLVQKFNSSGIFQLKWGTAGSGNGQFLNACGVAVDSAGNVYVADQNNQRIQKFSSAGVFIAKWGTNGSGDGQLKGPMGVAVDSSDNVYVADTGNDRIQVFDTSGTFLRKWGATGSGDGQFSAPQAVAIDGAGTVYVADTGNNRIEKFSSAGTFIESCGSAGTGDGQFTSPEGVATDPAGSVYYVTDTLDDRVEKFGTAAAPVANAGPDQTVECAGATTPVTLNGSASTPGSGTINSYTWAEGANTLGTGSPLTVSLGAGSHTITLTVTDTGGGSATDDVVVHVVDTTAPSIQLNGANPLTVECHTSFSDPGATATDTCAGNLTVNTSGTVDPNTPGTYTIHYSASDGFNSASATRTVNVVDTTPPTINCPADITVTLPPNSSATSTVVNYPAVTANDTCSSTVTVSSSPASGSAFNVGTTQVNASASDGHLTSTCSFNVTVLYDFTGFFQPVANQPTFNVVQAGRAVPVKFSLSGYKGLAIFAAGFPASQQINCTSDAPVSTLDATTTAGGSSLSYDPSTDQYVYVWKTDSSWAGTCRQLVVKLSDGSTHVANFRFR
jgi:DNA-binding beta-propeller fold protein YncE